MSNWDFESSNNNSNKAEFTKFPVGITRIRVVDEEPMIRWTHWLQQFKRSLNCPGKGCPICEIRKNQKANKEQYTYPMARRLAIQVLNRETGKLEIMEQGSGFFTDLRDIKHDIEFDDKGNPTGKKLIDFDIKVRRRGSGKDDTSYRLDIDAEYPLSEADLKLLNDKKDLDDFFKPNTNEQILRIVQGEKWEDVMSYKDDDTDSSQDEDITIK